MQSRMSIVQLSLIISLATLGTAQNCFSLLASSDVDIDQLTSVNPWYIAISSDVDKQCKKITFSHSATGDDNLMMLITNETVSGKNPQNITRFMERFRTGQYKLWNTSDPEFDPKQPGNVGQLGMVTFVLYNELDGFDALTWVQCEGTSSNPRSYINLATSNSNADYSAINDIVKSVSNVLSLTAGFIKIPAGSINCGF